MKEKKLIAKKSYTYSGVIDMNNLKKVMVDWGKRQNCKVDGTRSEEKVHEDKKEIYFEGSFRREVNDWLDIDIQLGIDFRNMQIVEVEMDGVKKEMWKVDAFVLVRGVMQSDTEEKWTSHPVLLFTRQLIDKYIAKSEPAKAEKDTKKLVDSLLDEIRAYMNLEKLALE